MIGPSRGSKSQHFPEVFLASAAVRTGRKERRPRTTESALREAVDRAFHYRISGCRQRSGGRSRGIDEHRFDECLRPDGRGTASGSRERCD